MRDIPSAQTYVHVSFEVNVGTPNGQQATRGLQQSVLMKLSNTGCEIETSLNGIGEKFSPKLSLVLTSK